MNPVRLHSAVEQPMNEANRAQRVPVYCDVLRLLLSGHLLDIAVLIARPLEVLVQVGVVDRVHPVDVTLRLVIWRAVQTEGNQLPTLQFGIDQPHSDHQVVKRNISILIYQDLVSLLVQLHHLGVDYLHASIQHKSPQLLECVISRHSAQLLCLRLDVHSDETTRCQENDIRKVDLLDREQRLNEGEACVGCADDNNAGIVVDFDCGKLLFREHR